jgi:predicted transcriptional regulator
VERILKEQRRLKDEERRAEDDFDRLQREFSEAASRLSRLRKQQKFLAERGIEMVSRGLASLDELDAAEEAERRVIAAASGSSADVGSFDWALDPSLGFLDDPGSSGGTAVAFQGSSSS